MDALELSLRRDKTIEQQILCGILLRKKIPLGVEAQMFGGRERDLYQELHRQLSEHNQIEIPMIPATSSLLVEECLKLSPVGGRDAILKLVENWALRECGQVVLTADESEGATKLIQQMQAGLSSILLRKSPSSEYKQEEAISKMIQELDRQAAQKDRISGMRTGLDRLDMMMDGIEKGKFYVLGGLKKSGKSRFMIHVASTIMTGGNTAFINSLEMNEYQLNTCFAAWSSGISTRLLSANLGERDNAMRSMAIANMVAYPLHIYREYTADELTARLQYVNSKKKIDVLFVDYLQRMRDEKYSRDRVREVESISMYLANLSRDMNIAVVALCQLSGAAEHLDDDEIPTMQYLKESQAIAENADTIIMLHNADRKKENVGFDNEYLPANISLRLEQRYGPSGLVVKLRGDLRTCQFNLASSDGRDSGNGEGSLGNE
jgi:replicative DNA helicase